MADASEEDWNEGQPVLATAIGCAAIAGLCWFALPLVPPAPLPIVLAGAFLAAVAVWGIGYALTVRHSGPNARLLSFLLILAAGMGASYYVTGERLKADLRTLMEMELDRDGFPRFPAGVEDRGPLSKLYVAFVRELADGQRAFDAEAEKTGIRLLADAAALSADPKILTDCARAAGIKRSAHAMFERRRTRFKALIGALDATDHPEPVKRAIRDGMAGDETDTDLARMDVLQARILDAAQGACTVLARRRWAPQGPAFMFSDEADLEAFSAFGQQQNQANAELQRLQTASRTRLRESQQRMRSVLAAAPR